jgi:hypothetical protein
MIHSAFWRNIILLACLSLVLDFAGGAILYKKFIAGGRFSSNVNRRTPIASPTPTLVAAASKLSYTLTTAHTIRAGVNVDFNDEYPILGGNIPDTTKLAFKEAVDSRKNYPTLNADCDAHGDGTCSTFDEKSIDSDCSDPGTKNTSPRTAKYRCTHDEKVAAWGNEHYVSVLFTMEDYAKGAAHPSATYRTLTFNLDMAKPVNSLAGNSWPVLFKENGAAEEAIHTIGEQKAVDFLNTQVDSNNPVTIDTVEEFLPIDPNLIGTTFTLTDEGVSVWFDDSVTSHALAGVHVSVPFTYIQNDFAPGVYANLQNMQVLMAPLN